MTYKTLYLEPFTFRKEVIKGPLKQKEKQVHWTETEPHQTTQKDYWIQSIH